MSHCHSIPRRGPAAFAAIVVLLLSPAVLAGPLAVDDVTVEGRVTALGDSSLTVDGAVTLAVDAETVVQDDDGAALAFTDLRVGDEVEVEGTDVAGALTADLVTVLGRGDEGDDGDDGDGDDGDGEEVEVRGTVEAVDPAAPSLTVSGFTFTVTAETEIEGPGNSITLWDLTVGATVEVEGVRGPDGALVAAKIEVEADDDEGEEVEAEGPITGLGDGTLTVDGVEFIVTAETEIADGDDPLALSDLAVGVVVEVEGHVGPVGPVADRVEVEYDGRDDEEGEDGSGDPERDEVEVSGTVDAVGDGSLTVAGLTFAVTAETEFRGPRGAEGSLADVEVGAAVEVEGYADEAGALVATSVEVEGGGAVPNRAATITGPVEVVGERGLVVLGRAFRVLPTTVFVDGGGILTDPSSLAVGSVVRVEARVAGLGGQLLALRVGPADGAGPSVTGALMAVGEGAVEVAGVELAVDEATTYAAADGSPIALEDLAVGVTVTATAAELPGGEGAAGGWLAVSVQVVDVVEGAGTVSDAGAAGRAGLFLLGGLPVSFDGRTLVRDEYDRPLDPSALVAGVRVRVLGRPGTGGEARTSEPRTSDVALTAERVVVYGAEAAAVAAETGPGEAVAVRAFPNPTLGPVRIAVDAPVGPVTVAVFDVLGRRVGQSAAVAPAVSGDVEVALDLSGLPAGAYLYRVEVDGARGPAVATGRVTLVR